MSVWEALWIMLNNVVTALGLLLMGVAFVALIVELSMNMVNHFRTFRSFCSFRCFEEDFIKWIDAGLPTQSPYDSQWRSIKHIPSWRQEQLEKKKKESRVLDLNRKDEDK